MDVQRRGSERARKEQWRKSQRMRRGHGKKKNIDRGDKVRILFHPLCVCAAAPPNRSLGASSFWWMTGPLLADPGTYTGDKRAGGWKENKSGLWMCVLLLRSVWRCSFKTLQDWNGCLKPLLVCSACVCDTGWRWYMFCIVEPWA